MEIATDPLVHRLERMAKSVRRDLHKMHAFVRFRQVEDEAGERYVAWFEPDHHILEATAGFFVERFRGLDWTILTPEGRIRWDGRTLHRRSAGHPRRGPGLGPVRGGLAGLLREHLQPRAGQHGGHPRPHGEEVLEEHARDRRHPRAGPIRPGAR